MVGQLGLSLAHLLGCAVAGEGTEHQNMKSEEEMPTRVATCSLRMTWPCLSGSHICLRRVWVTPAVFAQARFFNSLHTCSWACARHKTALRPVVAPKNPPLLQLRAACLLASLAQPPPPRCSLAETTAELILGSLPPHRPTLHMC